MSSNVAISVSGLGKKYRTGQLEPYGALRDRITNAMMSATKRLTGKVATNRSPRNEDVWAVRNASFEIDEGEVVGVIGRNGAGKSTLLKLLSRITDPTEGSIDIYGTVGALLEVGTGFHPELTGRENVYLNGAILGMRRSEIEEKFDQIVAFSGVATYIDTPVKRYSSGMQVRLAFAVAAHLEPDILIVDEVLAVGDHEFQKKCMGRMESVSSQGRTVLFVSHSMPSVLRLCPRVILMDGGSIVADGPAREVVGVYLESGLGTTSAREWASLAEAPGDSIVRLKAISAKDEHGEIREEFDIRRPIDVEVEYWQLPSEGNERPGVVLSFVNDQGTIVFASSTYQDLNWQSTPRESGLVRTTCRVPGNFLAEGQLTVHVAMNSMRPPIWHLEELDAIAFHVVDRIEAGGVRGSVGSDWPGVVRPMLDWRIETLADESFTLPSAEDLVSRED